MLAWQATSGTKNLRHAITEDLTNETQIIVIGVYLLTFPVFQRCFWVVAMFPALSESEAQRRSVQVARL